jgi:hypothetical protein
VSPVGRYIIMQPTSPTSTERKNEIIIKPVEDEKNK